jgi:nucleoside-diphosphate-sugar epimerase
MDQAPLFITGGSGFIGGALIKSLSARRPVVAMARSDRAAEVVASLGARAVGCSLETVGAGDLDGCEVVVHCAAEVGEWAPPGRFQQVNVSGTSRLLDAARRAGVKKFVHMSTDSVLSTGRNLRSVDESMPVPLKSPFPYATTKADAERAVMAANDPRMETVAIRPTLVWGPGDKTVLPEVLSLVEQGKFVWIDKGKHTISTTHIENLAHGVGLAIEQSCGGEVFFLTDQEPVQLRSFLTRYAAAAQGVDLPGRSIPGPLVRGLAWLVETLWRAVKPESKPPLTRLGAALLSRDFYINSDKAARLLGYRPLVTIETALESLRGGGW